ncbi:MAG: BphX family protein [Nitriliruptorales bacterium]|nr:BphX family protein [Nitriliruptorales bacterium]
MENTKTMRRWLVAVGIFYLVMGIRLLPWINGPMIESFGMLDSVYTGGDIEIGTPAYAFLLDWMATFGATLIPLGAVLLVASRDPIRNRLFAHLVIGHEIVAGILDDLWFISRDYASDAFYLGFIVVHVTVIATGIRALRRTPRPTEQRSRGSDQRPERSSAPTPA